VAGAQKVVVVGAGAIGLSAALYLTRRGAEVVVLDRGRSGAAASAANAGWITPGLSQPLTAPRALRTFLEHTFRPGSPLALRPQLSVAFLQWARQFLRHCTPTAHHRGIGALASLNTRTWELLEELEASGTDIGIRRDGILCVARTPAGLAACQSEMRALRQAGAASSLHPLDGDACRAIESGLGANIVGGVLVERDGFVDPAVLIAALASTAQRQGAVIREQVEVKAVRPDRGRWVVAHASGQEAADKIVIATGAASSSLLAGLGLRLPMTGGKGYSVTMPNARPKLRLPVELWERRVVCTPLRGGVRVAGYLELGATDVAVPARRVNALMKAPGDYLEHWAPVGPRVAQAGLRPVSGTGLPVIDELPRAEGAFVAAGHGMLGITLAAATGSAVATFVLTGARPPELEPFRFLDGSARRP
jgi:D-amino-acid dehydrogenase